MNAKHRKTLAALMADPMPKALPFRDVEALLRSIGCEVREREGSRVSFDYGICSWSTHRPHPGKDCLRVHVKGARNFLEAIGVTE